jgi:hypothetical protein
MFGIGFLGKDCEIESGGSAPDDIDLHLMSERATLSAIDSR